MKKLKLFSSALPMLFSFVVNAQKINHSETIIEKISIEKNESPKIHLGRNPTMNQPLYVIDGIISTDSIFKTINPENIKTINVLKGNGATAIYSEAGKNGVVIIETKSLTKKQLRQIRKQSEKALKEKNKNVETTKNL